MGVIMAPGNLPHWVVVGQHETEEAAIASAVTENKVGKGPSELI